MQKLDVNLYPHQNQYVQDAYDGLVANLLSCDPIPKTLCVTSNTPGAGKTTISVNLAISFVMTGRSTLLIDADIRKNHLYKRLGTSMLNGLSDFLTGSMELGDIVSLTDMENLAVITSGRAKTRNPLGLLYSPKFDRLLKAATERFDLVIIDTSSLDVNADSSVIASKADGTLLVVQINDSAKALERNIMRLNSMGTNIIGTVLNKIPRGEYKTHMEFYNYRHTGVRQKRANRARKASVPPAMQTKNKRS